METAHRINEQEVEIVVLRALLQLEKPRKSFQIFQEIHNDASTPLIPAVEVLSALQSLDEKGMTRSYRNHKRGLDSERSFEISERGIEKLARLDSEIEEDDFAKSA